jgi:hypothetical protein
MSSVLLFLLSAASVAPGRVNFHVWSWKMVLNLTSRRLYAIIKGYFLIKYLRASFAGGDGILFSIEIFEKRIEIFLYIPLFQAVGHFQQSKPRAYQMLSARPDRG